MFLQSEITLAFKVTIKGRLWIKTELCVIFAKCVLKGGNTSLQLTAVFIQDSTHSWYRLRRRKQKWV